MVGTAAVVTMGDDEIMAVDHGEEDTSVDRWREADPDERMSELIVTHRHYHQQARHRNEIRVTVKPKTIVT